VGEFPDKQGVYSREQSTSARKVQPFSDPHLQLA
jgi:hypothetical protein